VREGDTLSDIATMFNVSINTIMWANDISKAKSIRPGETLIILPVSGISYTVKKGDTVQGIAGKYKADVTDILNYNGLADSDILLAGQTIIIPDAEIQTAVPTRIIAGTGSSGPSYSGYYIRPIKGGVRSQGIHGYNGVDLAAPLGTPVYASAEGTVILSKSGGYNGGYGNYIIVSHPNGTQTLYAHLSRNLVSAGTRVEQGEEIAKMGSTGKSTGSHVHFEIRGAKNPF
jgi:murein DD-endopeptidase MepM/ murein hydrolase activator NlpD